MTNRLFLLTLSACLTASSVPLAVSAADVGLTPQTASSTVAASATSTAQTFQSTKIDAFKVGQKLTTPSGLPASVLSPIGNLVLGPGSSLEYRTTNSWKVLAGKYHLALRDAAPKRLRFTSPKARITTSGATFDLEIKPDGTTLVSVRSGSVTVAKANGAYPTLVKAGFQTTVGTGRPAKPSAVKAFDGWFADIPASPELAEQAWTLTKFAQRYIRDCTVTTISAMPLEPLNATETKALESFNAALDVYKVRSIDTYQLTQSLLSTSKEKTTETQKLGGKIFFDSSWVYYPTATGTWNKFQDKEFTDYMFGLAREKDITSDFDKPTFKFSEWMVRGQNRVAVFEGSPSAAASDALIKNTISQGMPPAQELAKSRIFLAETGGQPWIKYDESIKVYSGKVAFTLVETCNLSYGDSVKIKPPAATTVTTETGRQEMQQVINSVQ